MSDRVVIEVGTLRELVGVPRPLADGVDDPRAGFAPAPRSADTRVPPPSVGGVRTGAILSDPEAPHRGVSGSDPQTCGVPGRRRRAGSPVDRLSNPPCGSAGERIGGFGGLDGPLAVDRPDDDVVDTVGIEGVSPLPPDVVAG